MMRVDSIAAALLLLRLLVYCFIMLPGQSFCLANVASNNQRYFQSNDCERNTTDENINPRTYSFN